MQYIYIYILIPYSLAFSFLTFWNRHTGAVDRFDSHTWLEHTSNWFERLNLWYLCWEGEYLVMEEYFHLALSVCMPPGMCNIVCCMQVIFFKKEENLWVFYVIFVFACNALKFSCVCDLLYVLLCCFVYLLSCLYPFTSAYPGISR